MAPERIGRRAINRAFLARQLLTDRAALPVIDAVEHLVGLQAQAPRPPYFALWSRLADFRADDLARTLADRRTVRMPLMRGTVHWVIARDCRWLRPLTQIVYERSLRTTYRRQLEGLEPQDVADAGATLLAERPSSARELGTRLAERFPDRDPETLSQVVRYLVPVVQLPPRGMWGQSGEPVLDLVEHWIGQPLAGDADPGSLVSRYLASYGPASVKDVQAFSGLTRLAEVVDELRPGLRTLRDENGTELFDLPDAPRPGVDHPAPVRFLAEFDNAILSHADRTRIISDAHRKRIASRNGQVPGTFLVDGEVRGVWKLDVRKGRSVLRLTPYERLSLAARAELTAEGQRLLGFASAGTAPASGIAGTGAGIGGRAGGGAGGADAAGAAPDAGFEVRFDPIPD